MSARIHSTPVCNRLAAFKVLGYPAIHTVSNLKSTAPLCIVLPVVD